MRRVCLVMCHDDEIVEEAVQSASATAWRKLDTLEDHRCLRPWLVSVAVNESRQLLRSRGRRAQLEVVADPTADAVGGDPAANAAALDLRRALAHLDPDDRALLAMRYVVGFGSIELSAVIGLFTCAKWGRATLTNDGGAWEGEWTGLHHPGGTRLGLHYITTWLSGTGDYEGLVYMASLMGDPVDTVIEGLIYEGPLPATIALGAAEPGVE